MFIVELGHARRSYAPRSTSCRAPAQHAQSIAVLLLVGAVHAYGEDELIIVGRSRLVELRPSRLYSPSWVEREELCVLGRLVLRSELVLAEGSASGLAHGLDVGDGE
ncbi:hypothetical protein Dimus_020580, partial [Dionaea muscipula]